MKTLYLWSSLHATKRKVYKMHVSFTSCNGQRRELVFDHSESSTVVRGDPQIVPSGRFQVQHYEITAGFDVVRNLVPLRLVPAHIKDTRLSPSTFYSSLPSSHSPFLVLHHEMRHSATTVHPGWQTQRHRVRRHVQESWLVRNDRLWSLCPCIQNVRSLSSADGIVARGVNLITRSTEQTLDVVLLLAECHINRVPFTKLRFVVQCESVQWGSVAVVRLQLHR